MLSLSECLMCMSFVYLHHEYQYYLCFTRKTSSYCIWSTDIWLLQVGNFWKKIILQEVIFLYQWIIQCNKDSGSERTIDGVNIYLYGCVSILPPECTVCVCVCSCVCNIKSDTSKKPYYVSDLSKLDALLHKTHKVLLLQRYQGLTCANP